MVAGTPLSLKEYSHSAAGAPLRPTLAVAIAAEDLPTWNSSSVVVLQVM